MITWSILPEPILIEILSYFQYYEVIKIGNTCKRWHILSKDNLLWKHLLCRDFRISPITKIHSSGMFWLEEYKRLIDDTPNVMSEELFLDDEVFHVTFSNSGKLFVTCCKDANFIVSNIYNDGTTSPRYRESMRRHGWQLICASNFNSNDSKLLVAGALDTYNGEIAIYECTDAGDYEILCIMKTKKDMNSAWFDDNTWLSGDFSMSGMDSAVYMCRTYADHSDREHVNSDQNILFKLENDVSNRGTYPLFFTLSNRKHIKEDTIFPSYEECVTDHPPSTIEDQKPDEKYKTLLQENKFCLIFLSCGNLCVPHQVCFKRLYPEDLSSVPVISKADKLIEMHGQIVGIAQDREEKFLYVNVRRWSEGAVPRNYPPLPIANDIETRVIDLQDLSLTGQVYRGHKGNTDADQAFFIYPDVGTKFVGSGSEDGYAYIWDKHYGCQLAANKHDDVVNCVAFSPTDSHVMVSVGDDQKVKVWISRSRERSVKKKTSAL